MRNAIRDGNMLAEAKRRRRPAVAPVDTIHDYGACGDKVGECTHCSELRGSPNFDGDL